MLCSLLFSLLSPGLEEHRPSPGPAPASPGSCLLPWVGPRGPETRGESGRSGGMSRGPGLPGTSLGRTPGAGDISPGKGWGWAEGVAGRCGLESRWLPGVVGVAGSWPTASVRRGPRQGLRARHRVLQCQPPGQRNGFSVTPDPIFWLNSGQGRPGSGWPGAGLRTQRFSGPEA